MSNQKTSRKRGLYFHARTCITKRQFLRVRCEGEFTTEVTDATEKCSPILRIQRTSFLGFDLTFFSVEAP